jgi:hypothetical protein
MRWRDILKNVSFILRTKYCVGVVLLMLSLAVAAENVQYKPVSQ